MVEELRARMQQCWGYDSFRPLQREAMLAAMEGRDSVVVLPTGGGKSLCYQLPAVCRDGMAIVVSPLIALMKDQVDALTQNGIPAAFINSSLSTAQRMAVADRVRNREIKLLFAAPERLVQDRTIRFLQDTAISFIAIDEAHCISQWGHDFRPEYRQLNCLRTAFPQASLHALTATATEKVRADIAGQLGLADPEILVGSFDRPNLLYRIERRTDVMIQIREVIDRHPNESGIIYCISRASVESTSATLNSLGYRTLPYHAGLEADERRKHQEAFIDEQVDIIVATVAFGMGIDKSNVRYVIHAEMPRNIEAYQQESGRAGRDGLEAECCLFYSGRDGKTWEFLINQSEDAGNRARSLAALAQMDSFCASAKCRHRQLVRHFGQDLESENCGACDVCLREIEPIEDPLVVAQKILSSVFRQEQRFGADYTAQVLRGSRNKKVLSNGHDRLSTYGLLRDESDQHVRGWIDQLVAHGYLVRSGEYSVLTISDAGWQVLKGRHTPQLTRPRRRVAASSESDKWVGVNRELFEDLRRIRQEVAADRGVPPYVIFGDVTLRELARLRPTDPNRLLQIYGIGERKKREFGAMLIDRIADWCRRNGVDTDVMASRASAPQIRPKPARISAASGQYFELFDSGLGIDEVALQLDRSVGTVCEHLASYVHVRKVTDAAAWIRPETVERVEAVIGNIGCERLKPIFEALNEEVSYGDIRVVVACFEVRHGD
ncbi:MAG: DNA helicase RecQ [Planctomycetaceae bacterium]